MLLDDEEDDATIFGEEEPSNFISFAHVPDNASAREEAALLEHKSNTVRQVVLDTIVQDPGCNPVTIVNVVSTYSIGSRLNSVAIALLKKDKIPLKFNVCGFAAMIIPISCHGIASTTVLVYPSGCVVHTGAKDESHSRLSAWLLANFFEREIGIPMSVDGFKIRNIVSNMEVGHCVNLQSLKNELGVSASYEPADIQCVIHRDPKDPKRVTLIYGSGSAVLTGSKNRDDIFHQYRFIVEKARKHRMAPGITMRDHRHIHKNKALPGKLNKRHVKYGKKGAERDCYVHMDPYLRIGLFPKHDTSRVYKPYLLE